MKQAKCQPRFCDTTIPSNRATHGANIHTHIYHDSPRDNETRWAITISEFIVTFIVSLWLFKISQKCLVAGRSKNSCRFLRKSYPHLEYSFGQKYSKIIVAAVSQVLEELNGTGAVLPLLHFTAPELDQPHVHRLDLEKVLSGEAILFQLGYHGYPEASMQQQEALQCLANTASSPRRLEKHCSPGLPLDPSMSHALVLFIQCRQQQKEKYVLSL